MSQPLSTPNSRPASETYSLSSFSSAPQPFYNTWDHRISPYAYIERTYGTTVRSIEDQRAYKMDALVGHLVAGGAILLERTERLKEGGASDPFPYPSSDPIDLFLGDGEDKSTRGGYYLFLYKQTVINVDGREGIATIEVHASVNNPNVAAIHGEFAQFLAPRKRAAVSVLLQTQHGMVTRSIDFEPPVIDDLELNYGEGFAKVDAQIVGKLKEGKAGLFMFHGIPGVGKTVYVKHLTSRIDREFIFIPIGLAGELASPSFLNLLLEHEGAVIVLEDAEQALQSREVDHLNSSTVSTLLNLADGLLGNLLNISILATYNSDRQMIDKALLRKGRLSFDYTFEKLSLKDAKRLAAHLKKDPSCITGPTSLADIYNAEDDTGYVAPVEKVMGFGAALG